MSFEPIVKTLHSSDGTTIHAEIVGNLQKPCLVFVHGLNMSCLAFDGLFRDSSMLREVCMARYDLRGHGRSGKPEDPEAYKSSLYADDFVTVMQEFGFSKPILVAWSYGGTISADIYANLSADTLAGIVYVSAVPYIGPPMFPDSITPPTIALIQSQMVGTDITSYFRDKAAFVDAIWKDIDRVDYRLRLTWLGPAYVQTPQVMRNIVTRPQDPAKLLEVVRSGIPVLMLYGDADKMVLGEYVAEKMKPHCTNAEVYVVKGGGHAPFFEDQEEVVRELLRFVGRVTTSSKL
ncbi:Alpha/Beta hydrolase protein [Fomitopsis serialis]|uniref:Alpha/Beta hydrolase protein n=1 Tax=Fomitopsis serialis TaxID=139415 RepID=UPI002008741D|nr:Alpha/Beta hydrolase protein [Neoantrodia serialis]KAH9929351.1 Alpha/Beta hydrolase protein [Neoantrodia serialis]